MRLEDARYDAFRVGLPNLLKQIEMEEIMQESHNANNSLGRLNEELFAQLDRLSSVDPTDRSALEAEIERSKAVEGIAKTIIDNAETVLSATRMRASYTKNATMPRMLEG